MTGTHGTLCSRNHRHAYKRVLLLALFSIITNNNTNKTQRNNLQPDRHTKLLFNHTLHRQLKHVASENSPVHHHYTTYLLTHADTRGRRRRRPRQGRLAGGWSKRHNNYRSISVFTQHSQHKQHSRRIYKLSLITYAFALGLQMQWWRDNKEIYTVLSVPCSR